MSRRRMLAAAIGLLTAAGVVAVPASAQNQPVAAAQVLTWTANDSMTEYASAPTQAVAGETTIVFENSTATGNTTGMAHTLTFDTSTPGYNHDVNLNILATPTDSNNGRHEQVVTLTPGTYRYFCAIPGHGQMVGELVVTDGGGEDTTPPTVSGEVSGQQDADGNYIGSATVTVTAEDAESGVDSVEYQLDGGEWTAYTEPVVVNTVGEHTVAYRATDAAGNVSEPASVTFTVVEQGPDDTTPPTVSGEVSGQQDGDGNYVGSATVTVTAEDAESGVDSVEYQLDGGEWTAYTEPVVVNAVGEHMVHFRATDVAGNVSEEGMVSFTVVAGDDTTPPTVSAVVTGTQNADWEYLGSATITMSATDDGSGVASIEYALDDGAWTAYTEPVTVDTPGTYTLRYRATDAQGNVSPEQFGPFTIVRG